MKKILLVILLSPLFSFCQTKYVQPFALCDLSSQRSPLSGASANIGALLGSEKFVQIGLLFGYRQHPQEEKTYSGFQFSLLWRIQMDKFVVLPMVSVAENSFHDLSIRVGYAIDKSKMRHLHIFGSSQMGIGIGASVKIN